jgi:hypothetical protein
MQDDYARKSKIAFGFALICVFFIVETVNADRLMPNKASPYIWSLLAGLAVVCFAYGLRMRSLSRRK